MADGVLPWFDLTLSTPAENLALDEALLLTAEAGAAGPALRFWEWPDYAIVVGAGGSVAIDVDAEACRADNVSIHRRASGGGTVVLGPGCLLYSLVLGYDTTRELADVTASYRWILGRVRAALGPVLGADLVGTSDLADRTKKFSGNAQQRKARYLLHHGTLLYHFDLPRVGRYLKSPERMPAYREGRDHAAFLRNLPADAVTLKRLLVAAFDARPGDPAPAALDRVPSLVAEKYGRDDWVRRR